MKVWGKNRKYFSKIESDLKDGDLLAESGVYVETNLSANNSHDLVSALAGQFNYPPKEFEIKYH